MTVSLKITYKFNKIPIKMPKYHFIYPHRLVLKFLQKKKISGKNIKEINYKGIMKENTSYQIQNTYEVVTFKKSTLQIQKHEGRERDKNREFRNKPSLHINLTSTTLT